MAGEKKTVLIVDDDKNTRDGLVRALARRYEAVPVESGEAALALLEGGRRVDIVLSDMRMPGMPGLELLKRLRERHPGVPCVMLTAYGTVDTAVEAMRNGARDFLMKPVSLDQLDLLLEQNLGRRAPEPQTSGSFERMIGSSAPMQEVFATVQRVAPTTATVLIQGPSGTGKELVARAVHDLSRRAAGPFVAVNCAALAPTLLESELFGHEKGAFTGAVAQRKGRFEQANGGTLFLDEISEIEPPFQVKLLRALESRSFERVGGSEPISVDIRLVAATNRDLAACVRAGTFREDLYFRLAVVDLRLPALRERGDDVGMIAQHYLTLFAKENARSLTGFSEAARRMLAAYEWPGNVRELRNTIERMVVLSSGAELGVDDIPPNIREAVEHGGSSSAPAAGQSAPAPSGSLADLEKQRILEALEENGGNRSKAADALGISRRTLHRRLKEWGEEA